ncbi:hypothetical protein [Nostoc sp.]|uniref:hypothetical protein n=1 Tax=Nostoc sp. TaxID=1180 RepID=UPI002FFD23D9
MQSDVLVSSRNHTFFLREEPIKIETQQVAHRDFYADELDNTSRSVSKPQAFENQRKNIGLSHRESEVFTIGNRAISLTVGLALSAS